MGQELGIRHSALWIIFAVLAVGIGAFMGVILSGVVKSRATAFSIDAPGGANFALADVGDYTIFAEYGRTQDSLDMARPDGIDWLDVSVRRAEDNTAIAISSVTDGEAYAIRRRLREPLYTFSIDAPGAFRVDAVYPPGEEGPPIHLMLHRSYEGQVVRALGEGLAVLAVTAVAVVMLVRWGRRGDVTETAVVDSV